MQFSMFKSYFTLSVCVIDLPRNNFSDAFQFLPQWSSRTTDFVFMYFCIFVFLFFVFVYFCISVFLYSFLGGVEQEKRPTFNGATSEAELFGSADVEPLIMSALLELFSRK